MTDKPTLEIIGYDGNAFSILSKAKKVARKMDMDWEMIYAEATEGDYDNLLWVMQKYFNVV